MNFRVKKIIVKRIQKKEKKLIFKCYNSIISWIPWNDEVSFFEVDVQQGNSMILWLFLQVLIFCFLEKIISSIISKTLEKKNTRNFRG